MVSSIRKWLQKFELSKDASDFSIILAAIERLRRNEYIDRKWMFAHIVRHLENSDNTWAIRRKVKKILRISERKTQSTEQDWGALKALRLRKHQASAVQKTLLYTGVGAYGLPMRELVKDDLLPPFLYHMASGDFRLSDTSYQNLKTLEGCYKLYLREYGSKFGEKRLLCVLSNSLPGGRSPNSRGKIDARGIALEVARDMKDESLFVRRGSFIPFDQFCVSPLAWTDKIEVGFQNYFSNVSHALLDTLSAATDEYLNILTIKDIGAREIAGTYQFREKIGRFFGVRADAGFTDSDVSSLGILSDTQIANLNAEEQRRFEQIKFAGPTNAGAEPQRGPIRLLK